MNKIKIVHLNVKEPFYGENDFYFGSVKAIYDKLPEELIGIKYKSLTNHDFSASPYSNKRCTIKVAYLERKQNIRTKNKDG